MLRRGCLVLMLLVGLLVYRPATAQVLDEIDARREGADAVIRLRMVGPVRLQRALPSRDGELTVVQYDVLGLSQDVLNALTTERKLQGHAELPLVAVTDEAMGTRLGERKLVARLTPAARVRVRAGRDGRSIELVLAGLGPKVSAALPITLPASPATPVSTPSSATVAQAPTTGWRVLLQSSSDAQMQLAAPVPKAAQDYNLDTATRVGPGGQRLYEFYLGPMATQAEAERLLGQVRERFPQAMVVGAVVTGPATITASVAIAASAPTAAEAVAPAASAAAARDTVKEAESALTKAREAAARGDWSAAVTALNAVLELPPNPSSRAAQALIGEAWLQLGQVERARREFELFLKLYADGDDVTRVRAQSQSLPPAPGEADASASAVAAAPVKVRPTTTALSGSIGTYFYGGQSKVRSEEFKDSPISGLPELQQNPTLSGTDQKLVLTNVDLNYRHRTAEDDFRFVFRDVFQANLMPDRPSRNRLSALYADYRLVSPGLSVRLGRQSPTGAGVMGRFDGVVLGYAPKPRWKLNVLAGRPTDRLGETKRAFWGASVDAEALTDNLGASLYVNDQRIDGLVDRRAIGTDVRYYKEGLFASGTLDYDIALKALNIASVQSMWQQLDKDGQATLTVNAMFDRRAQPLVMLGSALFFADPSGTYVPVRMADALALRDLDTLRSSVRATTAYSTQGVLSVTVPMTKHWQLGGDVRLTKVDAIQPVSGILPYGQPATGNIWGVGGQLIGSNLYSERDTHVLTMSVQRAPQALPFESIDPLLASTPSQVIPGYTGLLVMYNNVSVLKSGWTLEPNLQLYRQTSTAGLQLSRVKPGMRMTWRVVPSAVVEASMEYEITRISSPTRNESANRMFYYLGSRYEF